MKEEKQLIKFSVIIPAYNEEEFIEAPIRALHRQSVPRGTFEVIVVDNNSKDRTSEAARRAGADKVILETTQGTNIARQRGVVESSGKILAFLDADCVPPHDWLEKIETFLNQPGIAAVSGPYDYQFQGFKRHMNHIYTHRIFPHLDESLTIIFGKKAGTMMGGNWAARRATIEKIGGLPPIAFYGDDATTAIMISRKVGKVLFTPKLEVASSARRFERQGLIRTTLKYARHYLDAYFSLPAK